MTEVKKVFHPSPAGEVKTIAEMPWEEYESLRARVERLEGALKKVEADLWGACPVCGYILDDDRVGHHEDCVLHEVASRALEVSDE